MPDLPEHSLWLAQADHDLAAARDNVERGWYDVAIFLAQQGGEKFAKALWIFRTGELAPRTHEVGELLESLGAPDAVIEAGHRLAKEYVPFRYPIGGDQAPFEVATEEIATAHIAEAEELHQWVISQLSV